MFPSSQASTPVTTPSMVQLDMPLLLLPPVPVPPVPLDVAVSSPPPQARKGAPAKKPSMASATRFLAFDWVRTIYLQGIPARAEQADTVMLIAVGAGAVEILRVTTRPDSTVTKPR